MKNMDGTQKSNTNLSNAVKYELKTATFDNGKIKWKKKK